MLDWKESTGLHGGKTWRAAGGFRIVESLGKYIIFGGSQVTQASDLAVAKKICLDWVKQPDPDFARVPRKLVWASHVVHGEEAWIAPSILGSFSVFKDTVGYTIRGPGCRRDVYAHYDDAKEACQLAYSRRLEGF